MVDEDEPEALDEPVALDEPDEVDEQDTFSDNRQARYERQRQRFLKHEGAARSTGIFYFVLAGMILANAILYEQLQILQLATAGISIWVGFGLLNLNPSARIGAVIVSISLIGLNCQSFLYHGYFLFLLFGESGVYVFSDPYQIAVRRTPKVKSRPSVIPLVVSAIVLILFVVGVAYQVHLRQLHRASSRPVFSNILHSRNL